MKLELKHYVGYFPYGLIGDLNGQKIILSTCTGYENGVDFWSIGMFVKNQVKPILRPMSSLIDEEMLEIEKLFGEYHTGGFVPHYNKKINWFDVMEEYLPFNMDVLQYLYSKHFDVFNLIEQGLAIKKED